MNILTERWLSWGNSDSPETTAEAAAEAQGCDLSTPLGKWEEEPPIQKLSSPGLTSTVAQRPCLKQWRGNENNLMVGVTTT